MTKEEVNNTKKARFYNEIVAIVSECYKIEDDDVVDIICNRTDQDGEVGKGYRIVPISDLEAVY